MPPILFERQDECARHAAAAGVAALPLESSPEERSASESLRACLFERSEFAGPPLA